MTQMTQEYLTPAEVAAELRVSTDTVLRLVAKGRLPALRVSPRVIRIPVAAFRAFQEERGIEPQAPATWPTRPTRPTRTTPPSSDVESAADRVEIRRLLAMTDREREAHFLASNRNMLAMFRDAHQPP